jgi:tRNA-guanine family transglycosylase
LCGTPDRSWAIAEPSGYIKEDVPPYNTVEILDYYQNLGFDFGVSIDHLIVGPFAAPGIREQRYDLTMKNAQEFIEKHQAGGYTFTPIGVAQGWSPETYAEAVKENIRLGYDYIALGGLARAQSKEIIEILKVIRPHLAPNTRLHLFGVARLNAIPVFRHLGVTSFDSASALRRAWLGSGANYHTLSGKMYTAARIPPVDGHGVRVKRLLEANVSIDPRLSCLNRML